MRRASAVALAVAALGLAACGGEDDEPPAPTGNARRRRGPAGGPAHPAARWRRGFDQPLGLVPAPGSDELYVVEQPGRVVLLDGDGPGATLLDIRDRVLSGGEQGLLGLAFHPEYARNGRLFVHYTNDEGDTRVDEYRARDGVADTATRAELLAVEQPYPNHNGGQLSFGPDGLLYLGLGDGGGAFDPENHAQDLEDRLGKLLRLDVDSGGADWEPVAYGLRNPWRFSWDRETGVALDRRRRPGRARGDRRGGRAREIPRRTSAGPSSRATQRLRRARARRPGAAARPGGRVRPRRRLLGHRRVRLPREPRSRRCAAATSTATSAAESSGR